MLWKFGEVWYQDYLLSWREQCRDHHEINLKNKIGVEDVVLVKNPAKTRPFWLLGRILELIMDDDNKVRSVKVKRGYDSVQIHLIKLLYPLELSLTHAHHPGTIPSSEAAGDERVNNFDESRESPKEIKISRENVTLPMIRIYIYIIESSHNQ